MIYFSKRLILYNEIPENYKKDLIFLSNDIIFTKNWLDPILLENKCISMPCNNQIFQYQADLGILKLKPTMKNSILIVIGGS